MQKPILLAMNNPYSLRPEHALYPSPQQSAGYRLYRTLHERRPDILRRHYIDGFERRNLVIGHEWNRTSAREAGRLLWQELEGSGRVVVGLGREVQTAMLMPWVLIHPQINYGVTFRCLPHPSGRNMWYNDPSNRLLAGMLLSDLYDGAHK